MSSDGLHFAAWSGRGQPKGVTTRGRRRGRRRSPGARRGCTSNLHIIRGELLSAGGPNERPAAIPAFPWQGRQRWFPLALEPGPHESAAVQRQAKEVARLTLGPDAWDRLRRDGFLDVPSGRHPGVTYRLRVGHRIEVVVAPGIRQRWRHPFLCVVLACPLPAAEFLAHLYLYLRDDEAAVRRVAVAQPWDATPTWTFGALHEQPHPSSVA